MTRQLKIKQPFNLELSLTMGQAFRWRPLGEGWFSGVIGENLVHIRQTNDGVEYRVGGADGGRAATDADDQLLYRYFRLDDDIDAIYASITRDPKVDTIVREFPGLRLLRQNPWECLAFQLCAANNDAERADGAIETIAEFLGTKLKLDGDVRHAFPAVENLNDDPRLSYLVPKWLLGSKRTWSILDSAKLIDEGKMDWDELRRKPYIEARESLLQFPGVNDKTADRIALFGLGKLEAFPLDKWVWRAITQAYPELGFPENPESNDLERRKVAKLAPQVFGQYAGYANQYLFHWRRQYGEQPLPFATRWRGKLRITPPEGRQLDDQYLDDLRYEYLRAKYLSC